MRAYVTFQTEEAYQKVLNTGKVDLMNSGRSLKFEEAPEPTNITWENMQYNHHVCQRVWRWLVFSIVTVIVFALTIFATYWISAKS